MLRTALVLFVMLFAARPLVAQEIVTALDLEWHLTDEGPRRFVTIARGARDESLPWRSMTNRPFDRVEIADAPDLVSPMTVTLLGTGGTRVTRSATVVYLAEPGEDVMRTALEIDAPDVNAWSVALRGDYPASMWLPSTPLDVDAATMGWAFVHQLHPHVGRYELDADLELVDGLTMARRAAEVLVRDRRTGMLVSRHEGEWIGTFSVDGTMYLALTVSLRSIAIVPVRTREPASSCA